MFVQLLEEPSLGALWRSLASPGSSDGDVVAAAGVDAARVVADVAAVALEVSWAGMVWGGVGQCGAVWRGVVHLRVLRWGWVGWGEAGQLLAWVQLGRWLMWELWHWK